MTGSDRDADHPENARIIDALRLQKIEIYPQDGSYLEQSGRPRALVYSTAIEESNPDFLAGEGIPRLHRAELLSQLVGELGFGNTVAVTGSCGKSTVTAYLAEALTNLGADPCCLNGALSKRFRGGRFAGNYRPGEKDFFVFEADESDKSLLRYSPDYAVILNLGTDHYDREELIRVFTQFLKQVKKGAVLEAGGLTRRSEKPLPRRLARPRLRCETAPGLAVRGHRLPQSDPAGNDLRPGPPFRAGPDRRPCRGGYHRGQQHALFLRHAIGGFPH